MIKENEIKCGEDEGVTLGHVGIERSDDGTWHNVFLDIRTGCKFVDPRPTANPFLASDEQEGVIAQDFYLPMAKWHLTRAEAVSQKKHRLKDKTLASASGAPNRVAGIVSWERGEDGNYYDVFIDHETGEKHRSAEPTVNPFLPSDEQRKQFDEILKDRPDLKLTPMADMKEASSQK